MRKFYETMTEAKRVYYKRTGVSWEGVKSSPDITIYLLTHGRNSGKYFVGTHSEWLKLS